MSINTGSIYLLMGAKLSHIALLRALFTVQYPRMRTRSSISLKMVRLYIAHWLSIAPLMVYRGRTLSRALYTALARGITPYKITLSMPTHPAIAGFVAYLFIH